MTLIDVYYKHCILLEIEQSRIQKQYMQHKNDLSMIPDSPI